MKLPFLKWLRRSGNGAKANSSGVRRFEIAADAANVAEITTHGPFSFRKLASDSVASDEAEAANTETNIDIWIIPAETMPRLARDNDVLSAEECRHADQIKHKYHRIRYIAVRTALRFALSHRVQDAIQGDGWKISTPPFGKPQICSEQANCSFSITHADDFSVIAVAPDTTVGIDAEKIDNAKLKHLPLECLSENEQKRLNAKTRDDQYYDFFRFWTLKEAYTKALGVGLSADFERIEFDLNEAGAASDKAHPNSADEEQYELLTLKYLEFEHLLAICLLGVDQDKARQTAKTLYLVEPSNTAAKAGEIQPKSKREIDPMGTHFQIIDMANPERIELYALEDLPDTLHQFVEAHAETDPDHIALEIDGEPLTYGELNAFADKAATYLIDAGVTAGDFVAVYQNNSADLFISLLGVMKAGGAYVPVDTKRSNAHAMDTIKGHDAHVVLTSSSLAPRLEGIGSDRLVLVDQIDTNTIAHSSTIEVKPSSISHVAFKAHDAVVHRGIPVTHSDAVKFAYSLAAVYGIEPHHRCYQDGHLSFDVALEEVWAMLAAGATVVLESEASENTDSFIARNQIHVVSTGPETLETMDAELPSVEVMIVGGRPCASTLAVKWALRTGRIVSIKRPGDRFPSFSIEQESGAAWRPRMLPPHAADRQAA